MFVVLLSVSLVWYLYSKSQHQSHSSRDQDKAGQLCLVAAKELNELNGQLIITKNVHLNILYGLFKYILFQ